MAKQKDPAIPPVSKDILYDEKASEEAMEAVMPEYSLMQDLRRTGSRIPDPWITELTDQMAEGLQFMIPKLPLAKQLFSAIDKEIESLRTEDGEERPVLLTSQMAWSIAFAYASLYEIDDKKIKDPPTQVEAKRQRRFMKALIRNYQALMASMDENDVYLYSQDFMNQVIHTTLSMPELQHKTRQKPSKKKATGESFDFLLLSPYINMTQGPVTNRASVLLSQSPYGRNVTRTQTGRLSISDGQMRMFFDGLEDASPSAQMFYDVLSAVASRNGLDENNFVYVPIRHYMKLRDLKDEKSAREQAKRDLRQLATTSIEYEEQGEGKAYRWNMINLSGGEQGIQNSTIYFQFSDKIAEYMKRSSQVAMPTSIFKIRLKTRPNAYAFGRRIALHYRMNTHKPNATTISVLSLLRSAPNIPTYEEVKSTSRKVGDRIIKPFEDNMDELTRVGFIRWEYVGPSGALAEHPVTYEDFVGLNIRFYMIEETPELRKMPETPNEAFAKSVKIEGVKGHKRGGERAQKGG